MEPSSLYIGISRLVGKVGYESYKENKRSELIKRLSDAQIDINSSELQNDDFIRCFIATSEAISKCTNKIKLSALTKMFVKGVESKKLFEDTDRYQEVLSIVSDLSFREIKVLYCMYDFDFKENNNKGEKTEAKAERQLFYIAKRFDTEIETVKAWVIRLKRTGLLLSESELRTNESSIYYSTGFELHHLSPMAKDLKKWILFAIESEDM